MVFFVHGEVDINDGLIFIDGQRNRIERVLNQKSNNFTLTATCICNLDIQVATSVIDRASIFVQRVSSQRGMNLEEAVDILLFCP